jgi:hypothetical protein
MTTPDETPLGPNDSTIPTDIDDITVPRKIPAHEDIEGQQKAITGALASALLTATEMPIHMLIDVLDPIAKQMVAYGVRQTDAIDPAAIFAPGWITDGAKQMAQPVPEQQNHQAAEPVVVRTAEAPPIPKRFPSGSRAKPIAPVDVPVIDL